MRRENRQGDPFDRVNFDPIPNHPDRERARRELESIEGFGHLKNPMANLADYIDIGLGRVNIRIEEASLIAKDMLKDGLIEASEMTEAIEYIMLAAAEREAWVVAGPSGSGKTLIRKLIGSSNPETSGFPIAEVSWERDGLKAARDANELDTPVGQKASPGGLMASNNRFSKRAAVVVRTSPYTVIELPLDAVAQTGEDGELLEPSLDAEGQTRDVVGSPRGLKAFMGLLKRSGDFRDLPRTKINVVLMVGGYFIRNVLVHSREEFANINLNDPEALEKAKKIATRYGKAPPTDLEQLAIVQADGANPQLVRLIEEEYTQMAIFLWNKPDFDLPPGLPKGLQDSTIRTLMNNLRIRDAVRASQLEHMYKVLKPGKNVTRFVAHNNPGAEKLGLDLGEIKKYGSPEVQRAIERVQRQETEDIVAGVFQRPWNGQ